MDAQRFEEGDRVRIVGHPDHVLPRILQCQAATGGFGGVVTAVLADGLRRVVVDGRGEVQVHVEQLEAVEG